MRIATWNLNQNRGFTAWPILRSSLGADIVLLQESKRPDWDGPLAWLNVPHHEVGSAVISTRGTLRPETLPGYEGWVVGGELIKSGFNDPERPLFVFSVHAPSSNSSSARMSYVEEVTVILALIKERVTDHADLVIGGDFNFLSLGHRKQGEAISTTAREADAMRRFAELGLESCWAATHPDRALAQTLRWTGDKTADRTTPYHCDGIFVPHRWQSGLVCEVLTSKCFESSDHYPVAAWLQQESIKPRTFVRD